ncbi:MAG: DUF4149 domain-containing protein [Candidatus Rokubacteria bacterium]|nr:DUF4149 domain-containing protein [Candidatus Rokubacteria bacterium]
MNFLKLLTIVSVSFWLGAMVFFSAFVAPAAFSVLDRESAGRLVSMVFPRYYVFGIALGIVALAGVLGRWLSGGVRPWGPLVLLVLMLGMNAFTWLVLLPQLQALRSAAPGGALGFARLHLFSVALNLTTMLAGLTLVVVEALGTRPGEV